jgi:septal ring factor EnvC (AmiA/AmiB activator)
MSIIEDWYSIDADGKNISLLQKKVEDQSIEIRRQSEEIQELRSTIHSLCTEVKLQQTAMLEELKLLRTNHSKQTTDLLEELKVIKQRELNLLLREKIPVPFHASTETVLTRKILL